MSLGVRFGSEGGRPWRREEELVAGVRLVLGGAAAPGGAASVGREREGVGWLQEAAALRPDLGLGRAGRAASFLDVGLVLLCGGRGRRRGGAARGRGLLDGAPVVVLLEVAEVVVLRSWTWMVRRGLFRARSGPRRC